MWSSEVILDQRNETQKLNLAEFSTNCHLRNPRAGQIGGFIRVVWLVTGCFSFPVILTTTPLNPQALYVIQMKYYHIHLNVKHGKKSRLTRRFTLAMAQYPFHILVPS